MVIVAEREPQRPANNWPARNPRIHYLSPNLSIGGKGKRYLRWLLLNQELNQLSQLIEKEKITAILGVFPDDFYLYLAYRLSQRHQLPFYSWFHNTYVDNYTGLRKYLAKWLQPRFWRLAKENFVISEGMRAYYREEYPEFRFSVLSHGFPLEIPAYKKLPESQGRRKFLFTGSLNQSCADAALRLMKVILEQADYELHAYSGSPLAKFTRSGITGPNFFYHGFVSDEEFYAAVSRFDVLLLPHGFQGERSAVEFQTIFPTRTIPLLVSNRPILAHSPPGVYLTKFLRQNDCALVVDQPEKEGLQSAIERLFNEPGLSERLVRNALATAQNFSVRNVAQQLRKSVGLTTQPKDAG